MLAGIGVALGATIGALLPVSSTENRLMGEAADDVKARARRLTDKVKEGAQTAYDEAKDAAGACLQPQGATSTQSQGSSAQSQGVMSTMEGSEAAKTAADLGHS